MGDELEDSELCELTSHNGEIAIARCVDGLGCSVFANGNELPAWASQKVEELLQMSVRDQAVMTTQTRTEYFVLNWNKDSDDFALKDGPLTADELRARHIKQKGARL